MKVYNRSDKKTRANLCRTGGTPGTKRELM